MQHFDELFGSLLIMKILCKFFSHHYLKSTKSGWFIKGGIQQLRGQNFAIFWPPPPCVDSFLYHEHGQKQTFLTLSPPHLFHVKTVSKWMSLYKWSLYHLFWSFFHRMCVYLSQNWGSDGQFEVLNGSKSWLGKTLWPRM